MGDVYLMSGNSDLLPYCLLHRIRLGKKCRNITYIFPECPVVGGGGEGVYGPLLEQAAGHHVDLYLLQDVPQHLVTRL